MENQERELDNEDESTTEKQKKWSWKWNSNWKWMKLSEQQLAMGVLTLQHLGGSATQLKGLSEDKVIDRNMERGCDGNIPKEASLAKSSHQENS